MNQQKAVPMRVLPKLRSIAGLVPVLVTVAFIVASCGSSTSDSSDESESDVTTTSADSGSDETSGDGLNLDLFADGALSGEVTTEDCTLSGGAETTCYNITIAGYPVSYDVGPFCPDTITDDADAGGIWFDGDAVYDLDGEFIETLSETYDDDGWQMYDEDGNVYVTDTQEAFEGAAVPDVADEYQNNCIEGRLEWLDNGEPITSTVQIPVTPVAADSPAEPAGNQGVTLDGIVIAESAPVSNILGAYTIAAFDDCGGHFNPFEGYHLHGAVGCSETGDVADGETAIFGYAMDGYAVHSPLADEDLEAAGLDACNGHTTETDGYHYHANSAEKNQVIECLVGQTVSSNDGAGGPAGGPPDGGPPEG